MVGRAQRPTCCQACMATAAVPRLVVKHWLGTTASNTRAPAATAFAATATCPQRSCYRLLTAETHHLRKAPAADLAVARAVARAVAEAAR